ncbi:MAG: ATPase, T2SS/T4P/T4SS family [Bacteriovoracales bacterium]|nr:ATPase, T2SS/T4P/T4SS family [Bacteriovoracales bacterium]
MAGYIATFIGGKGGVGKSILAANFAYAHAQESRSKVLLLDFDQKAAGDLDIITGLRSKKTLKDLSDFHGAIDIKTIQQFIVNSPGNVSYISLPSDVTAAQAVNTDGLGKFLKMITNIFPLTVIDGGCSLNDLSLKALEYSTAIFMTTSTDLLAINQCRRMFSDIKTMLFPPESIQLLLNQYQKGHPVTPEIAGRQIGRPVFAAIPKDEASCVGALNKKKPAMLVAKNSPFSKALVDLSRKLIQKNVFKSLARLNRPEVKKIKRDNTPQKGKSSALDPWTALKARIHKTLIDEIEIKDSSKDDESARIIMREKAKKTVVDLLSKEDVKGIISGREEMNQIVKEILDEALGLGPLEDLLADREVSEVMVNGPYKIYYEKSGKIKLSTIKFTNDRQVLNVIERIVHPIGRRIDEKTPYVDARLHDGSRVHAIIPPSAIDGCTVTIRKFPEERLTYKDLVNFGSMTQEMADFLRISVEAHRNVIVSGGTGSGKTTLINVLGSFIPANERIITCEDSAELSLPQEHIVRLETRPPTLEGDGEIDIRLLVKQTLRMRPDRIIVGECRGGEALDMLQAMNTGHDGSMTTVHSNTPRDCVSRLETLVQYAGAGLSPKAIRQMVASALHIIVQQSRLDDGSRKVMNITEVQGIQGDTITLQDIFYFKQEGIEKGKIKGKFYASGLMPKFIEVLAQKGHNIPKGLFTNKVMKKAS